MIRLKLLHFVIATTLLIILVGCGSSSPSPISQITTATYTPQPSTSTLMPISPSPTLTHIPPTVTSTPLAQDGDTLPTIAPTSIPELSLSGSILDQGTNRPIAGTNVSLGDQTTTTDVSGEYSFVGLASGQYILSVTQDGYDPALSPIFTLVAGEAHTLDLTLYPTDTTPYPEDPMLTNPLDPNGAPTAEDAEKLARLQGLSDEVVNIEETKLSGEFLINYKIGDDIRAAVANLNHEVWKLTDETGQEWFIIKACGNLATRLPKAVTIPTPPSRQLPLLAQVLVDDLPVYTCASEECAEVTRVQRGDRVEVGGCLVGGSWCQVTSNGMSGWCAGQSLQHLAVATIIPQVTPTPTSEGMAVENGKIAFKSNRDGDWEIYEMSADGNDLTRLTNHAGTDESPTWSPDGQRIAFYSDRDGNGEIYAMNVDGTGLTRLTNHPSHDTSPAWSPDGRRIAFISDRDEPDLKNCWPNCNYEIYIINVDNSSLMNLTNTPGWEGNHAWLSNDRIIFSRGGYIYTVNSDGSNVHELSEGNGPILSPDGSRFVYFRSDPCCMWVMDTDGSGLTLITDQEGTYQSSQRAWSPDGQKIAFGAALTEGDGLVQIYLINADGSNLTRLTDGPGYNSQPAWSPDGQKIVFVSFRDGNDEIYTMNANGSEQTRLTNNPANDVFPAWLPQ